MKNWNDWAPFVWGILGGIAYSANSDLLPGWSHLAVSAFTVAVAIAAYWLIPAKLKTWLRVLISAAVTIAAAAITAAVIA